MDVILAAVFSIFALSMILSVVIEKMTGISGVKSTMVGLAIFLIALSASAWPIYTKSETQERTVWRDSRFLLFTVVSPIESALGGKKAKSIVEDIDYHDEHLSYYWRDSVGEKKRKLIDALSKKIYLNFLMSSLTMALFLFIFALRKKG